MLRFAAALAVCAFTVAGCSTGDGSPTSGGSTPPASSSAAPGATSGNTSGTSSPSAGTVPVVAVYRPVCGPEPLPTPGATPAGCPDEPVVGVEVVATRPDGSVAGKATTDREGRLALTLVPGTYLLTASAAAPPRITPQPTRVTVGTVPMPTVTLVYESSMQ